MDESCKHQWRRDLWMSVYVAGPEVKKPEEITTKPKLVPLERCPKCGAIRLLAESEDPEGGGWS